jgi:hypothetical protein
MAKFSMRLVQQITEQGYGDFVIDAETPEAAAVILGNAPMSAFKG